MLQFLCLQMCVYGWGVVPQGGVGDRHLVTIPQGVLGDRLPWGGERHGGVRVLERTRSELMVVVEGVMHARGQGAKGAGTLQAQTCGVVEPRWSSLGHTPQ